MYVEKHKRFPVFVSHEATACFRCSQRLPGAAQPSGHATRRGPFVKQCSCGYRTWYDIQSG